MALLDDITDKLEEAEYFLDLMREHEKAYQHECDWSATQQLPNVEQHKRRFEQCLSAFLAASQSVRYYIEDGKLTHPDTQAWQKAADAKISFKSFRPLRNTIIHKNTVSTNRRFGMALKSGLGSVVADPEQRTGPDFVFSLATLQALPKFAGKTDELEWLTDQPLATIVGRTANYLSDLRQFVDDGQRAGIL